MSKHLSSDSAAAAPSNSAYINLSNYVYQAVNNNYLFPGGLETDIGFEPLDDSKGKIIKSLNDPDGFYGEAFISVNASGHITSSSKIVIAYEGTNLLEQTNTFTGGQLRDDADIAAGTQAPSYKDAEEFAREVVKDVKDVNEGPNQFHFDKNDVFLTGHSLGAADAEYAAEKTGLGGVTFAAPGIEGKSVDEQNLTDYIDNADPIGNYAKDDPYNSLWGNAVTLSDNINHYGHQIPLENTTTIPPNNTPSPYNNVQAEGALGLAGMALGNAKTAAQKAEYIAFGTLSTLQSNKITIGDYTPIQGYGNFHSLSQYASDLNLTLYTPDATTAADTSFFPGLGASAVSVASNAVCFASGTRIRVIRDGAMVDVSVEQLLRGDLAVTASGAHRPIRWLGHRTVDCRRHREPELVQPVRIAAHAFGAGLPSRDLMVSPGHALCVDVMGEALVPAGVLVNGSTIAQLDVARITYWHVELDAHDIVLAENMPAESYLELGNRSFFAEAEAVALQARPDAPIATIEGFCRPYVASGPMLDLVRARLAERAGAMVDGRSNTSVAA